ncbi:MAG: hypothetical protein MJE68_27750, partial [Proteobacteria bacterium]|nr:hypothetical protein [Pseudomonadota bacterium]
YPCTTRYTTYIPEGVINFPSTPPPLDKKIDFNLILLLSISVSGVLFVCVSLRSERGCEPCPVSMSSTKTASING